MPELDEKGNAALIQHPVSSIEYQPQPRKHSSSKTVTVRERFYPCTDLSLPFLEEILPHRRTCQVNRDFPPNEVCQGREFRTDSLPLPLSSGQPVEEAEAHSAPAARWRAERVRLDRTAVAAAGIAGSGVLNKSRRVEEGVAAALQRMMQERKR